MIKTVYKIVSVDDKDRTYWSWNRVNRMLTPWIDSKEYDKKLIRKGIYRRYRIGKKTRTHPSMAAKGRYLLAFDNEFVMIMPNFPLALLKCEAEVVDRRPLYRAHNEYEALLRSVDLTVEQLDKLGMNSCCIRLYPEYSVYCEWIKPLEVVDNRLE
jgi:hypothetical protein